MNIDKLQLYDYQQVIVDKTLEITDYTLIKLPTGGGKTLIASEIIRHLTAWGTDVFKQILFVAPKIVLMDQTIKAFEKEKLTPHKIHGNNKYNINHRLFVSTIHTASKKKDLNVDVIIIDEVHYGANGKMFKNLIKNNPNARIIGLSATPYTQEGKKLKGFVYIDDIDVKHLMNNNFLVQRLRQYELVKQDLSGVAIYRGDYNSSQLSQVVCNKNTIVEIIETTSSFISKSKKTIVFAVDIMHAELLTKAYQDAGFIAKALHSKMNKDENLEPMEIAEEIENFRIGSTKILVSVLMLTTGFDVPDTDCAIIARPTKSQILYKQMVGRILRKSKNKKEAVLLDCGNVIQNLGMPLAPITEVGTYNTGNSDQRCSKCNSLNIKLVKEDKTMYWICTDCGYKKDIENSVFKCKQCLEVHSYDSDFTFENDEFILNCTCGYKTVISKYTNEKLVEIIDKISYSENDDNSELTKKPAVIELEKEEIKDKAILTVSDVENCLVEDVKKYSDSISLLSDTMKSIKLDSDMKYAILSLLEDKLKQVYSNEYEIIYAAIINNDYIALITSVDKLNKGDFTTKEVFSMYEEWLIVEKWEQKYGPKHSFKEHCNMEYFESCNANNQYKVFDKLIEFGYFDLFDVMSIAYHDNLDELTKHCLKKYNIQNITFSICEDCFDYQDFLNENIDKKYFNKFSSLIESIDISESFDITSFILDGDADYNNEVLYALVDRLMYFNSFLSKLDIKVLLYGREVKFHYWSYKQSYDYLLKQNINSFKKWFEFKEGNENILNIPKYPNRIYTDEWQGWFYWLNMDVNTIPLHDIQVLYEKELSNMTSPMRDKDIIKIESLQAKKNIKVGSDKKHKTYSSFNKAREYVRALNLKSKEEWNQYKISSAMPSDIPQEPHSAYAHKTCIELFDLLTKSKDELLVQIKIQDTLESKNLESTILVNFDRIESKILDKKYTLSEINEIKKSILNLENYYANKLRFIV